MNIKFRNALLLAVGIIIFLAFVDIQFSNMWWIIGGHYSPTYQLMEKSFMFSFWLFAYGTIALVALMYYLIRKDKSETLAIIITSVFMLWAGLEDLFFYIFRGIPLEASMPWLYKNGVIMGPVARILGYDTVTPTSLIISIIVTAITLYFIVKWLEKQRW